MSALALPDLEAGDCLSRAIPESRMPVRASIPWRDIEIDLGDDFILESGERLKDRRLRLRVHGRFGLPIVIAAGGVSAGRKVADAGADLGWWRGVAGRDAAIDLDRFQLVGFDFLPGEEPAEMAITPADQARALGLALVRLGVEEIHGFVGASYGGLVALSFAALFPARLAKLCVISAAAWPDPMATALRGIQRRLILFARECGRAQDGVALARELAMTTYRTADEFRARFDSAPLGPDAGDPYDVCAYLTARGRAYSEAMPAERYLTLSDSLDRAQIEPAAIEADCLFIASATDRLVPPRAIEETARLVAGQARFQLIDSLVGHDAFLCDARLFTDDLAHFLQEPRP